MSRSMGIFVRTHLPLPEFVSRLEDLLGVDFEREEDEFGPSYEAVTPIQQIVIYEHTLVNDRDLDFENYKYELEVLAVGVANRLERFEAQEAIARQIMETLKQTAEFRLMLVEDVQENLDEFSPQPV